MDEWHLHFAHIVILLCLVIAACDKAGDGQIVARKGEAEREPEAGVDYGKLVDDYLAWRPPPHSGDVANPHRALVINEGENMAGCIAKRYEGANQVPLGIIWVLGEIGSPSAFDLLMKEYMARPNFRTAISAGSCLDATHARKLDGVFAGRKRDYEASWSMSTARNGRT